MGKPLGNVTGPDRSELAPELDAWVRRTAGEVVKVNRLPGGNRREAWAVDVSDAGRTREVFLRYDAADPRETGDPFTISREAGYYLALKDSGVAIPEIIAVHPILQAMLCARVRGSTSFSRIADIAEKNRVAIDFIRQLARLHSLDPDFVKRRFPTAAEPVSKLIAGEIDIWQDLYLQTGRRDPLIEFAWKWLTGHIPTVDRPACIVHGDAGPGNFLFDAGKVTALLDWELAHLGDPLEDLAWVSFRHVLEPVPDFPECLRAYELATGQPIDRDRLRYHRVMVHWRITIIRHRKGGEDVANSLVSSALNRRLLVESLAEAANHRIPPYTRIESPAGAHEELFESALEYLRDIIAPATETPFAAAKVKSVARVVKYLQQVARFGPSVDRLHLRDLASILGRDPSSIESGEIELADRVRRGEIDDGRLLVHFARQVGRETQLMEGGLGALAWRPLPPIKEPK